LKKFPIHYTRFARGKASLLQRKDDKDNKDSKDDKDKTKPHAFVVLVVL